MANWWFSHFIFQGSLNYFGRESGTWEFYERKVCSKQVFCIGVWREIIDRMTYLYLSTAGQILIGFPVQGRALNEVWHSTINQQFLCIVMLISFSSLLFNFLRPVHLRWITLLSECMKMFIFEWLRDQVKHCYFPAAEGSNTNQGCGKGEIRDNSLLHFLWKTKSKEEYSHLAFLFPLLREEQCGNRGRKEKFYPVRLLEG